MHLLHPTFARRLLAATMPCPSTAQSARPLSIFAALRNANGSARATELGVGELEGAEMRIEPKKRAGEDDATKRARLLYQSRKRGTLESDLLLSTFAAARLPAMSSAQLAQYDAFLDENDWDIYYWATQDAPSSSSSAAAATTSPGAENMAAAAAAAAGSEPYRAQSDTVGDGVARPGPGEWAQTVGTFKPAHRPVPARWRDSEILRAVREHVRRRREGGEEGGGMGLMPELGEDGGR